MKVRYSRRALKQIDDAFNHIAAANPTAADGFLRCIEGFTALLAQFPSMGRLADEDNIRVMGLGGYPYLVFYQVLADKDELRILRVRHMARQRRPL